jgi:arylsulfatase A-like enzyme
MKVIVLILRGLHLGYVGCYGNGWIDTPGLDRLAAEGIVFDQHYADCPDSSAAWLAWQAGALGLPDLRFEPEDAELLKLLRRRGAQTRLVIDVSHPLHLGFAEGWDFIHRVDPPADCERPRDELLAALRRALAELSDCEQFLLWIDSAILLPPWKVPAKYLDPYFHAPVSDDDAGGCDEETTPLDPLLNPVPGPLPEPADESYVRLQSSYASAVSYADDAVGWLLDELRERRLADETLLVVTSDRGQALGEHGIVGPYRPWLHDELIHLPLVMRLPAAAAAGRRVAALTQSVDLYPTLLGAFGIAAPPCDGYSLLPLARGEVESVRSHVCCGLRLGDREEWALRTLEWSFILPVAAPADDARRRPQLYVKPDDRWEVNDVIQHQLDLAERFEQTLRAFMAAPRRIGLETPWTADSGGNGS